MEAALSNAARGWRVIPLHDVTDRACGCGKSECGSPGKHPRTKHGLKDGATDAAVVHDWWQRWPTANVGVVTGPESGIRMLGPDGEEGIADLAELVRKYGGLPQTPMEESGSGGKHRIYEWPADGEVQNRKKHRGTAIDVRGQGGYFVAAPSANINGIYRWEVHPDQCTPPQAPNWLLAWARSKEKSKADPA